MKKLLILFCVWLPGMYAGGEEKIVTDCCKLTLHDKEYTATFAAAGCGSLSTACCGAFMGGLCIQEGLFMPTTVMSIGAGTACVGVAGAVACAMCGGHYAQQIRESAVKPQVAVPMVRDIESQAVCSAEILE